MSAKILDFNPKHREETKLDKPLMSHFGWLAALVRGRVERAGIEGDPGNPVLRLTLTAFGNTRAVFGFVDPHTGKICRLIVEEEGAAQ